MGSGLWLSFRGGWYSGFRAEPVEAGCCNKLWYGEGHRGECWHLPDWADPHGSYPQEAVMTALQTLIIAGNVQGCQK